MLTETPDMKLMDSKDARNLRDGFKIKAMQNRMRCLTFSRSCFTSAWSSPFGALSSNIRPDCRTSTISSTNPRLEYKRPTEWKRR